MSKLLKRLDYYTAVHELRKANKGLRRSASKIRKLELELEIKEEYILQADQTMMYMATLGNNDIMPYEFRLFENTWHPYIKFLRGVFEDYIKERGL